MSAQVHQTDQGMLMRPDLATPVTLSVTGTNEAPVPRWSETSNTSLNGIGALSVADACTITRSVAARKRSADAIFPPFAAASTTGRSLRLNLKG